MSIYVAIATAAVEMLGGQSAVEMSRKPEIMADAAYMILTKSGCELTGQFLVDDTVLANNGVKDMDQYAHVPGKEICTQHECVCLSVCPSIMML